MFAAEVGVDADRSLVLDRARTGVETADLFAFLSGERITLRRTLVTAERLCRLP